MARIGGRVGRVFFSTVSRPARSNPQLCRRLLRRGKHPPRNDGTRDNVSIVQDASNSNSRKPSYNKLNIRFEEK